MEIAWLQIGLAAGIPILCGAVGYGVLQQKVKSNCDDINELKKDLKDISKKQDTANQALARIEGKLEGRTNHE